MEDAVPVKVSDLAAALVPYASRVSVPSPANRASPANRVNRANRASPVVLSLAFYKSFYLGDFLRLN